MLDEQVLFHSLDNLFVLDISTCNNWYRIINISTYNIWKKKNPHRVFGILWLTMWRSTKYLWDRSRVRIVRVFKSSRPCAAFENLGKFFPDGGIMSFSWLSEHGARSRSLFLVPNAMWCAVGRTVCTRSTLRQDSRCRMRVFLDKRQYYTPSRGLNLFF